jgi:ATP-dependent RNA helicase DDX42
MVRPSRSLAACSRGRSHPDPVVCGSAPMLSGCPLARPRIRMCADGKSSGMLPTVDHAEMTYAPFRRSFYTESPEVAAMTDEEIRAYRKEIDVSVTWLTGGGVPRPIKSFASAGFAKQIMQGIAKAGYEKPTPIQSQAWPVLMSGRDVIGIAKTGSGKTAAFVLPGLTHLMDQPELEKNDGPIMVVLAPTRELAAQIHTETKKFAKSFGLKVGAIYGGMSKFEQFKVLKNGVEVIVATPGRLIDLIKMKGTNLHRCTYIVLDEADRMLNMGFEAQVRSIMGQVRPERQTAMFSATFKRAVEGLARDLLRDPVRITIGSVGESNKDIQQYSEVLQNEEAKWMWLVDHLDRLLDMGQVLIFRGEKDQCDAMANKLRQASYNSNSIHGDKDQRERDEIMKAFKSGHAPILVATDVASRGLDIRGIKNVINFDVARDIDSHVHRIGRTGRAGDKGHAYTLIDRSNRKDSLFAGDLVRNLELSDQLVPQQLMDFAMQNPRFQQRQARNTGGGVGFQRGPGGGRKGANRARQQTGLAGLGYAGNDAGVLHKRQGPLPAGTGISAFVKSSTGPAVAEGGAFIPAKAVVASSAYNQRAKAMGMVAASLGDSSFNIAPAAGGLVAPLANTKAAQQFIASELNSATQPGQGEAATAASDWLTAAKDKIKEDNTQPKRRASRWGS